VLSTPKSPRYCVVALFEPMDVGDRFARSAWPAHVTLASNFLVAESVEQVVEAVHDARVVDRPLAFRIGRLAQFGPQRTVPVRLVDSPHVEDAHQDLAHHLGRLRGFEADEPSHWREGYRAHLTLRPSIAAFEGEIRTASHVAVARLDGETAEIVACIEIGPMDRPEIVCLCGSARFVEEMRAANRALTFAGVIVLAPGEAGELISHEQKTLLDALHLRKIDLADRILVVNPGGYIGESTRTEVAYAHAAGKPVSFTDPV
jgi:2'-5' RNA ligase